MKQNFLTTFIVLLAFPVMLMAQSNPQYNEEQLALRTDLFNFLKEEGFMPEIDTDGDVKFKYEGKPYYISVSDTDENPLYVVLYRYFGYPDEYNVETVVMATKILNMRKGIKVLCFDKSFRIGAELFVRNAEPVKAVFYKLVHLINGVSSDFMDACEKVSGSPQASASSV